MTFIRPEIAASLHRWREALAALALAALGLWVMSWSGYAYLVLGLLLLVTGIGWTILSTRRLRFAQTGDAPGIVHVTEAQIAFLGPRTGGFIGLPDLAELRLLTLRGRRIWKLRAASGETLHIPVESAGADALFDAFATLPGMDTAALVAALSAETNSDSRVVALNAVDRLIWARSGAGVVVR